MSEHQTRTDGHAIVIGAGMAGLCAASALAALCGRVTVIDRDALPADHVARAGVPQGLHSHALMARGVGAVDALFPGALQQLRAGGAVALDLGRDVAMLVDERWMPRRATGLEALFASRGMLEGTLRAALQGTGRVVFQPGREVTGLRVEAGSSRVSGVHCGRDTFAADLIIDASGRRSRAPEWLGACGFAAPAETHVDARVGYSTRWYEIPAADRLFEDAGCRAVMIQPIRSDRRSGVLFPIEDGRWIVSVVGGGGDYPPADADGFEQALRGLRGSRMGAAIEGARPLTRVYSNRATANRYRHYDRGWRAPAGFVALGDAVCSPNPVYAQGMTLSALAAQELARCVRRHGLSAAALPRAFFAAQAGLTTPAWAFAVGADFRFEGTLGPRPPLVGLFNAYFDHLLAAAADEQAVQQSLYRVIHLLDAPTALLAPATCARVARAALRRRRVRGTRAPSAAIPINPELEESS